MMAQKKEQQAGRGRPRDEEKNSAIIRAATELFLENGFAGTSMDEVARRAGVSKQTVYSHFSSKEQLFGSAVHAATEQSFPEVVLGKLDSHSLEGDLRAICESYARLLLSPQAMALHRLLVSEAGKNTNLVKLFMQSGPGEMEGRMKVLFQEWVDKGEVVIDDLQEAVAILVTLLRGRLHFRMSIGLVDHLSEERLQKNVDTAVDVFLRLYKKQPA